MPAFIEDYALIGDTQTAALVSKQGSVDWLCLPRFDSGAVFAALLGNQEHGHWAIAPAAEVRRTTRRYRENTLILETEHETADGVVRVVACMPPRRREATCCGSWRVSEGACRCGWSFGSGSTTAQGHRGSGGRRRGSPRSQDLTRSNSTPTWICEEKGSRRSPTSP